MDPKLAQQLLNQIMALYPNATPTLNSRNAFEILVAVLLSAQTTDVAVNAITPALFAKYPTPEAMASASVADIEALIDRLGLYKNKAKYLKAMSERLVTVFHGQVPNTRAELTSLAGVGQKTATVVLTDSFGIPGVAVDTHIMRIVTGFGMVPITATPAQAQTYLEHLMPEDTWIHLHRSLIRFGREWLSARNPKFPDTPEWEPFIPLYHPVSKKERRQ